SKTQSTLMLYFIYWVAGTKAIFIALIAAIVIVAETRMQVAACAAMAVTVPLFYYKQYPMVRAMDAKGEISPKGYSNTLGIMIGVMTCLFTGSAVYGFITVY
ncbi:hypothetical protein KIPB_011778, partial [Kipferlia bialata]